MRRSRAPSVLKATLRKMGNSNQSSTNNKRGIDEEDDLEFIPAVQQNFNSSDESESTGKGSHDFEDSETATEEKTDRRSPSLVVYCIDCAVSYLMSHYVS